MNKLYLISQTIRFGLTTYDSAVVCAESESAARHTHPNGHMHWRQNDWYYEDDVRAFGDLTWAEPSNVEVQFLGNADDAILVGVLCSSFNAG